MDPHNVDAELGSLDSHRAKYFEKQSKAQAAKIIDLEAKIVYLEAKVEHLEASLARERAQQTAPVMPAVRAAEQDHDLPGPSHHGHAPARSWQERLKRAASPEPPLFENRLSPSQGNPKKIKLEQGYIREDTNSSTSIDSSTPSMIEGSPRVTQRQAQNRGVNSAHPAYPKIEDRMTNAAWFPLPNLPQHLRNMVVARSDLSSKPLFVSSKLMFSRSGSGRNFIFLDAHHSPYFPSQCGAPGLLFSVSHVPQWQMGLQSVFTASHQSHKASKLPYVYVGEYRLRFSPPLSVEEYMMLSPQSKEAHASSILLHGSKEFKVLQDRIVPSLHNVQRSNNGQAVHEIVQAYERGSEKIYVWLMECVGFDEGLLQQIHQMKSSNGSDKKASKKAEASASSSTTKSTNSGKGKKKQHH